MYNVSQLFICILRLSCSFSLIWHKHSIICAECSRYETCLCISMWQPPDRSDSRSHESDECAWNVILNDFFFCKAFPRNEAIRNDLSRTTFKCRDKNSYKKSICTTLWQFFFFGEMHLKLKNNYKFQFCAHSSDPWVPDTHWSGSCSTNRQRFITFCECPRNCPNSNRTSTSSNSKRNYMWKKKR